MLICRSSLQTDNLPVFWLITGYWIGLKLYMVVAYQLIDSQIQLEFLESDEPFSRTFAPIASFAKKKPPLKTVKALSRDLYAYEPPLFCYAD
jgi:hypothetical protein